MVKTEEFLSHYGKKGMKWGVRRAAKKAEKADRKWQENIYSTHGAVAVHNAAANRANAPSGLDKLNSQAKYKHLDAINKPNSPLSKAYFREYEQLSAKWMAEAVKEVHGVSPSGKYKATLDTSNKDEWSVKISANSAKHANVNVDDLPDFEFNLEHDEVGHIISTSQINDELSQSITADDFFEHFGIKGMHWGVRNKTRAAIKSRTAARSERKSSDYKELSSIRGKHPSTLSNAELKKINERMNLEQNYNRLNAGKVRSGKAKAELIIGTIGVATTLYNMTDSKAGKAAINLGKKLIEKARKASRFEVRIP